MKLRILMTVLTCSLWWVPCSDAEETMVALAVSEASSQKPEDQELTKSLLDLLEFEVSNMKNIAVVERQQIDKILQEIVINGSRDVDQSQQTQLGKLLTAELILAVQLQQQESDQPGDPLRYQAVSTIVDSQTGTIRGRSVEVFRAVDLEEVSIQIARYLRSVIRSPQQSGVTLAIGVFESQGRFERLRPIETGLQELMTQELQQMGDFRVVRRMDMQSLNDEFSLMRSGLADARKLPKTLPNRSAAFLLKGTIDELNRGQNRLVVVRAELLNALSQKTVYQFHLEVKPEQLPQTLSEKLEELAKKLAAETIISPAEIRRPVRTIEAKDLYLLARRDLERFVRISPIDASPQWFSLPGSPDKAEDRAPLVDADSPLGRHLLLKSIDRLESALYINPELVEAQYSLAFCYAFHLPDVFNPDRAAQLLEAIVKQHPEHKRVIPALWLLSEIDYHHKNGRCLDADTALERAVFAFETMPIEGRKYRWTRLLDQITQVSGRAKNPASALQLVRSGTALVAGSDESLCESLAEKVTRLASRLVSDQHLEQKDRDQLQNLLVQWTEAKLPELPIAASRALAEAAAAEKKYALAAGWYARAAELSRQEPRLQASRTQETLLIKAATQQRLDGRPAAALKLLEQIDPRRQVHGHTYLYGLELGATLEALDRPTEALEVYLTAAGSVRGMTDNTDVLARIQRLGGVPLRDERDVNVSYVPPYVPPGGNQPFLVYKLATDDTRLFCAVRALRPRQNDVVVYAPESGQWTQTNARFQEATCLACNGGPLWVGTVNEGIWRYSPEDGSWRQWSVQDGLPDDRVVSLTLDGQTLYAGVGTPSSGGLVRIGSNERIEVLDGAGTPRFAPTHIAFDAGQILARTRDAIHRCDRGTGEWSVLDSVKTPFLFTGKNRIWASELKLQIYPFDPEGTIDSSYRAAWSPENGLGDNYLVHFVIERDDQIWFGGTALRRFLTTGLYRFDRKTGEFVTYGPRDGFRYARIFTSYDAVWALDRLWVAGDGGLAEVKFQPEP